MSSLPVLLGGFVEDYAVLGVLRTYLRFCSGESGLAFEMAAALQADSLAASAEPPLPSTSESDPLTRTRMPALQRSLPKRAWRFSPFDRVVCNIGQWAPGTVEQLDVPDPDDPTGSRSFPYVVQLDPPVGRLVSVPADHNSCIRPEVCFGKKVGAAWFTLACLPVQQSTTLRFGVGDRVACAVEDAEGELTMWEAGTVEAVRTIIEEWEGEGGPVPFRVRLDSGITVLVHRDVHWLVRDLALQPPGPRNNARQRFGKRQRDDSVWEDLDHETRNVRQCAPLLQCGDCDEDE
ncbi:hypothetical protein AB1Y20_005372 [Prymnesium parvum]|uniref:Uncharacterized protein n=1 Tax=Prymnesium parvum TaxID=97485 RepID=A0AB34J4F3_PRYPA